jgi:dTDP-4-amino-4,6-dideoxygalactose transaminase
VIPLFKTRIAKDALKNLKPVFDSGYIGEGEQVKRFEKALGECLDGYIVLVNSGTSALHLAYHIAEVKDREVITTPMTCMATNTPIVQNGGKIVWADVDPETGNISYESVKKLITPKTKAVVVVHYGGNLCDFRIRTLCDKNGIELIEDCAHMNSNGLGGLQCYSFQAIKFLTTGDGGCLVTKDKHVYERAKLLRWYGIDREAGKDMRCMNPVYEVGYKYHMNDIAASIGLSNLKDMDEVMKATARNAKIYNERLKGLGWVKTVPVAQRNDYWLYIILCEKRKELMDYLKDNGVATSLVHARNDTQPIFKKYKKEFVGLEQFWDRQMCIPVGWWVSEREANYIASKICAFDTICSY